MTPLEDDWIDEPCQEEDTAGPFPRKVHVVCRVRRTPLVFRSPKKAAQAWQVLHDQGARPPYHVREMEVIGWYNQEHPDLPGPLYLLTTRWSGDLWRGNGGFLDHPFPRYIAWDGAWAEAYCAEQNQSCRTNPVLDPFAAPVCPPFTYHDADDRARLLILLDYVQDLGLPAPTLGASPYLDWGTWWRTPPVPLEPWQREAIWTFLERQPPYEVVRVGLRA
jgi:hypothetical protein